MKLFCFFSEFFNITPIPTTRGPTFYTEQRLSLDFNKPLEDRALA